MRCMRSASFISFIVGCRPKRSSRSADLKRVVVVPRILAQVSHLSMSWSICLFLAVLVSGRQSAGPSQDLASIDGQVIQSATGEPVRKAHVALSEAGQNGPELVASTDETGKFRFAGVQPGLYWLIATKGGFLPGRYGQQQYEDDGTLLKVKGGDELKQVSLRLFPAGSISGVILDADGDPMPGAEVVLWSQRQRKKNAPFSPGDSTRSNSGGEYSFHNLMPGTYFVSSGTDSTGDADGTREVLVGTDGKPTNLHDVRTFYPSALTLAAAQSIDIKPGQQKDGIDVRLRQTPLLSVSGRIAGTLNPKLESRVAIEPYDEPAQSVQSDKILSGPEFSFDDLPPGKYRLTLTVRSENGLKTIGISEVELKDESVTGLLITPFKPAVVLARVVLEDDPNKLLFPGSVSLNPVEESGNLAQSESQFTPQDGVYKFDEVAPGKYQIGSGIGEQYYLKALQAAGRTLDPDGIAVAEGASLDLLLVYSKNVATVSGDVELPQDGATHSARVLLIAEDGPLDSSKIIPCVLDQLLHFSAANMRPGRYAAVAAEEDDPDLWSSEKFLDSIKSEGAELDLQENQHATVHLKLITKDATQRVRHQLGL